MTYNEYIDEVKNLIEEKNRVLNMLSQESLDLINHSNIGDDIGIDKKLVKTLKFECSDFDSISNLNQDYIYNQYDVENGRKEITRLNNILVSIKGTVNDIMKEAK